MVRKVRSTSDDDPDLDVFIELATISGSELPYGVYVKINLYDEEGDLYMTNASYISKEGFSGYDTLQCKKKNVQLRLNIMEK